MLMSMGFSREDNHHPFNSADMLVFLFLFLKKEIKNTSISSAPTYWSALPPRSVAES
jgi:hypothetical protein